MSLPRSDGAWPNPAEQPGGVRCEMAIQRKSAQPAGITNASGQPEIVLEIDGLTLSMTPPGHPGDSPADDAQEIEPAQDDR